MSADPSLTDPSGKGNNPSNVPQNCQHQCCPGQTRTMEVTFVQPQPVYGREQTSVVCQCCGTQVITNIAYRNGLFTWLLAFGLGLCGCMMGCCLIPFCVNDTKDVVHTCPNCQREIGRYKRI